MSHNTSTFTWTNLGDQSMRHSRLHSYALAALLAVVALAPGAAWAQSERPFPVAAAKPQPIRPYKPIAITLPQPVADASFGAFLKQLAGVASRKDVKALASLVVAKGFFLEDENGDQADDARSGVDNLSEGVGAFTGKEPTGWETIANYAGINSASAHPDPERKGVLCSPAFPTFNEDEAEALTKATQTDAADWVYPLRGDVDVRGAARADAPVIGKLGLHLVMLAPDDGQDSGNFLRIVLPSGRVGYVPNDVISDFTSSQICYIKDASGWKIAGIVNNE